MELAEILSRVVDGLEDPSYSEETDIMPLVNEFVTETSRLYRLPDLQARGTLSIAEGDISVEMPDNFHKDVYRIYNSSLLKAVNLRSNLMALEELYSGWENQGSIKDVAIIGSTMWVKPVPISDQELDIFYYREPVLYEYDDEESELDGIPDDLCHVAVDYVLSKLYPKIESGLEGRKPNTMFYKEELAMGMQKILFACKGAPKPKPIVKRTARFF